MTTTGRYYVFEHAKALCRYGTGGDVLATLLHQVHYWSSKSGGKIQDGVKWTYHTYPDWHEQFPWWSEYKIFRAMKILEGLELVFSSQLTSSRQVTKKWYRVNYNHPLIREFPFSSSYATWSPQNASTASTKCEDQSPQNVDTASTKHEDLITKSTSESISQTPTKRASGGVSNSSKQAVNTKLEDWLTDHEKDYVTRVEEWIAAEVKKRDGTGRDVRNIPAFRLALIKALKEDKARGFHYVQQEEQIKILRKQGGPYGTMTDDQLLAELKG